MLHKGFAQRSLSYQVSGNRGGTAAQIAMMDLAATPPIVTASLPAAAALTKSQKKHEKDKRRKSKKRKASTTPSSSGSSSSTNSSCQAAQAPVPVATMNRKPLFFKRAALPTGSLTHRMLPIAVIREILHVISPEECTRDEN
jgi:hypothetical protein